MYNLVRADLFKIRKSIAIKILFAITAVSATAMAVLAYLIPKGKIDASMAGIGFMFSDADIISILGAVLAGIFICGDFENKTIHNSIACGNSRGAVIISKTVTFFCAAAFILLPYAIVTGIALATGSKFGMGSVAVGFLKLLCTEAGKAFTASEILKLLAVMLTLIIVYLGRLSICIPLALVSKKPILVVAVFYGITILVPNLSAVIAKYSALDHILACTPFGNDYGFLTLSSGTGDIFNAIAVSLICTVVMGALTYLAFRKSEIK